MNVLKLWPYVSINKYAGSEMYCINIYYINVLFHVKLSIEQGYHQNIKVKI